MENNNIDNCENCGIDIELGGDIVKVINDYLKLINLPQINGVTLEGNKTTEELGIQVGSDIELITELKPESIEEDLEEYQVYNGNAIHDLARLFGEQMTAFDEKIENIENGVKDKVLFNASVDLNLATLTISSLSHNGQEIIQAYNEGKLPRLLINIVGSNVKTTCELSIVDGSTITFFPIMRINNKNYLIQVLIEGDWTKVTMFEIPEASKITELENSINSLEENKQDNLTAGNNIEITEDNIINVVGLPTNEDVNLAIANALGTIETELEEI